MFDGRTDDLDRLLVAVGIPSEDLTDDEKREGLLHQSSIHKIIKDFPLFNYSQILKH